MNGMLAAILGGLGKAATGLPEGMIAGQKLDQSQQALDESKQFRQDALNARKTDVGQLFGALGLQAPAGMTGPVDSTVATAAAGHALKEQERQRGLRERESLATDLERRGKGTPAVYGDEEGGAYSPGTPDNPKFTDAARFARAGAGVDSLFKSLYPDHDKPMVVDKQVYDPVTKTFTAPPSVPAEPFVQPPGTRPKVETTHGGEKKTTWEYPPQPTGSTIYADAVAKLEEAEAKYPATHPEVKKAQARVDRLKPMAVAEGGTLMGPTGTKLAEGPPKTQPLPAGEASTNADLRTFINDLREVQKNHKPEFTGPLEGGVRGKFRDLTGIGANAEEVDFRSQLSSFENRLLRLRSGAAVTPQEYERIKKELPQASDPDNVFPTKLARAIKTTEEILANREAEFKARGFRGGEPAPAAPSASPPAVPRPTEGVVRWGRDAQGRPVRLP